MCPTLHLAPLLLDMGPHACGHWGAAPGDLLLWCEAMQVHDSTASSALSSRLAAQACMGKATRLPRIRQHSSGHGDAHRPACCAPLAGQPPCRRSPGSAALSPGAASAQLARGKGGNCKGSTCHLGRAQPVQLAGRRCQWERAWLSGLRNWMQAGRLAALQLQNGRGGAKSPADGVRTAHAMYKRLGQSQRRPSGCTQSMGPIAHDCFSSCIHTHV